MPPTIAEQVRMIERAEEEGDKPAADVLIKGAYDSIKDDPQELQVQRSKNTLFGNYLRELALEQRPDETPGERSLRLGGQITGDVDVPYGEGLLRSTAAGQQFEFAEEITANAAAFLNKLTARDSDKSYSELYDAYLSRERAKAAAFAEKYPGSDITAKIVGGVTSPFWKALSTLGKLSFIPKAAKVTTPTTFGQAVRQGAKAGAYGGVLYGAGMGETPEDRAMTGAAMAAGGGLFGVGLGPLFFGVGKLAQQVMALSRERRAAKIPGTTSAVSREAQEIANMDESMAGAGQARIAQMGEDALLADSGPMALARLDEIIQSAAPGSLQAQQAVQARAERIGQQLTRELDDILGELQGVRTQEQLKALHQSAGKPYADAYRTPINYASDEGQELLNLISVYPKGVIDEANNLIRIQSKLDKTLPNKQIIATVNDDGTVVFSEAPTAAQIDFMTRGLSSIVAKEEGAGVFGGQTTLGSTLIDLASRTRSILKDMIPAYRDALKIASQNITAKNAGELGQEMMRTSNTRQDVFTALERLGARELVLVKQGLRQYLDDLIAKTKRAMSDPETDANTVKEYINLTKELSSTMNRDKLRFLLGERDAGRIKDRLTKQEIALQTLAGIKQNSATFKRLMAEKRGDVATDLGPMSTLLGGSPIQAAQKMSAILTGTDPASRLAARQAHDQMMAGLLSGPARGTSQQQIPRLDILAGGARAANRDAEFLANMLANKAGPAAGVTGSGTMNRIFD
tara:strand:- start:961 stop:3195 length:2235 start_codon:yes stop_codon:yes gene_type:complete